MVYDHLPLHISTKHNPEINTIFSPTNNIQKYHRSTGDPYIFYWSYDLDQFKHLILLNVSSPPPNKQQCDKTFLHSNTDQCDYNYKPAIPYQCLSLNNNISVIRKKQQLQHTASQEVNIIPSDNPPAPTFARDHFYWKVCARDSKSYLISL